MLVEELLERGEVDIGRVELYLAEIRVDRGVEGEVGADAVLQVQPGPAVIGVAVVEGVAGALGLVVTTASERVREQLEPLGNRDILQRHQVREARRETALLFPDEGEQRQLVLSLDPAREAHAPHLLPRGGEPQLGERNPQLDDPPERVDGRRRLPDRIPGIVGELAVASSQDVLLHARRVHDELERGPMIVVAVQQEAEFVAVGVGVAPSQPAHDAERLGVEQAHAHVQCVCIVDDPYLRGLRDGLSFVRVGLQQARAGRRQRPGGVVQAPVERRRPIDPQRGYGGGHEAVGVAEGGRIRGPRLQQQHSGDGEWHRDQCDPTCRASRINRATPLRGTSLSRGVCSIARA